jgi:hypothetical protein
VRHRGHAFWRSQQQHPPRGERCPLWRPRGGLAGPRLVAFRHHLKVGQHWRVLYVCCVRFGALQQQSHPNRDRLPAGGGVRVHGRLRYKRRKGGHQQPHAWLRQHRRGRYRGLRGPRQRLLRSQLGGALRCGQRRAHHQPSGPRHAHDLSFPFRLQVEFRHPVKKHGNGQLYLEQYRLRQHQPLAFQHQR